MANDMAEIIQTRVLDSLGAMLGQARAEWLQDQACSLIGERSALWWVAGWTVTPTLTAVILRKLLRNRYRVPHPNKTVAEAEPEVIIVGSGILGSSLAASLGRDGRKVTVIERDMREPDRIVGEFLQPAGVAALKELYLEDCLEGIDSIAYRGYVVRDMHTKAVVVLPSPAANMGGRAFHHGRLVQQLRKAAMAENKVTYIEGVVLEILEEDGTVVGVRYRNKGSEEGQVVKAPLVVVSDGIYSKFRKGYTKETPQSKGHFCGLLMENAQQFLPKHLELILAEPSFVINYKVSSKYTRALVDLPTHYTQMPTDLKAYLKEVVYPIMPENLAQPFLDAVETDRFRVQQLNFLPSNPIITPGIVLLGDALNVRHAVTAGGMTAALHDTILATKMLRKLPDLYDYNDVMTGYQQLVKDRTKRTFSINVCAFSLYHLYASPDYHMKKLLKGMLEYFGKEGFCKTGVVGILSNLTPQPRVILMHFSFAMFYAIGVNFREEGLLRFPMALYHGIAMLIKGSHMMAPYIWGEIKPF